MTQVENVALMSNRPDNNFVAVNMYCDDSAMIKDLAINLRASQIAECAGKIIEVSRLDARKQRSWLREGPADPGAAESGGEW